MSIPAYLIIGSPTSGRCGICVDVLSKTLDDDDFCTVFVSKNEDSTAHDKRIASAPNAGYVNYSDSEDAKDKIAQLDESKITHVIYIADSTKDLADEIESFKDIVDQGKIRLARIWAVVDCQTVVKYPKECSSYVNAMAHFADCMLLTHRTGLSNKDVDNIKLKYQKLCYPMMFEYVNKKFEVSNAIELMIEEARRISVVFDDIDAIDELDIDDDDLPEEPFDLLRKPDPYFQRLQNGMREKPIKDISKLAKQTRENS